MEPAATIIKALGGASVVAEHLELHRTTVSDWRLPRARGGTDGMIPQKHIPTLVRFAQRQGVGLGPADFFPTLRKQRRNTRANALI